MKPATRVRDSTTHRFKIGEMVSWRGPLGAAPMNSALSEVVRHLPPLGDDLQYRIKAVEGSREHVTIERELSPAGIDMKIVGDNSTPADDLSIPSTKASLAIGRHSARRT